MELTTYLHPNPDLGESKEHKTWKHWG